MYKVMVCNGQDTWVAKTCNSWVRAIKVAEKIKHECKSVVEVWIEKA